MNTHKKHLSTPDTAIPAEETLAAYAPPYTAQNAARVRARLVAETTAAARRNSRRARRGFRLPLVAAMTAVLVFVCGTALASVLGVDVGGFYNSFFNNPAAADTTRTPGATAVSNGVEITLDSVYTDGYAVHMLLKLKDLNGERLTDYDTIHLAGSDRTIGIGANDDAEDGTLAVAATILDAELIQDGHVPLRFDALYFDVDYAEALPDGAFDLAAHVPAEAALSPDATADYPLLAPGDLNLQIPGVDWYVVKNLGVIDGLLHMQLQRVGQANPAPYGGGNLILVNRETGDVVSSGLNTFLLGSGYVEVAFDLGGLDLSAYTLGIAGMRSERVVTGDWDLSFDLDGAAVIEKKTLTAALELPLISSLSVSVSPASTELTFAIRQDASATDEAREAVKRQANEYYFTNAQPTLTLRDGTTVALAQSAYAIDAESGTMSYISEYVDLTQLQSIRFCGTEYMFE
ncbi:MAG: DUF4179 domain-containing protein [Oscillospiraceae bacterium]|jgi:hypothetical protein|nr:DUF4179 domain-containing protein [Oscillospiraceae bacterium]